MVESFISEEQKKLILEFWEKSSAEGKSPSLDEISKVVLDIPFDGRTMIGRDLKKYVASFGIEPPAREESKRVELTEDQKAFIENHRNSMTSIEITRELFKDTKISNLSAECRAVDEFSLTLGPYMVFGQETIPQKDWSPPNTLERVVARVNKYFKMGNDIDRSKLTPKQKKEMVTLMRYLNTYRFTSQINKYESDGDRTLFESTFIRYTFDKSDLSEEDLDQFILLAKEAVLEKITMTLITRLRKKADDALDGDGDNTPDLSMRLVELIGKTTSDYDDCCKRQRELLNSLRQKRSERLAASHSENASILNLVELWKAEKTRVELLEMAQRRKEVIREEIGKLSNMKDVMCKILGLPEDEAAS